MSRINNRAKEREAKDLQDHLHTYINKFFKFMQDNREYEKQVEELRRLDISWKLWIAKRKDKYDLVVAGPMFVTEVHRLLDNKLAEEEAKKV